MRRPIDVLSAGELYVDLITAEFVQTVEEVSLFTRQPGGSAANLASNMARLGNKASLIACVGNDDMGQTLLQYIQRLGVDASNVTQIEEPTTLVLSTRAANSSNAQYYRRADFQLSIRQFPFQRFEEISIFHTTCFALSKQPAQQVLLQAAEKAKRAGCQLSLDVNFSHKIWPQRTEALRAIAEFCRLNALIKISQEDWSQLYDNEMPAPEIAIEHFLKMGASEVCITLGINGCWVGNSEEKHFLGIRKTDIKDSTNIGDAFWAGYLSARLDGRSMLECSIAARKLAEIKLSYLGPLPAKVDKTLVYSDLG
jgi:fructokinase